MLFSFVIILGNNENHIRIPDLDGIKRAETKIIQADLVIRDSTC